MRVAELPGVGQPARMATRPIPEPGPGEVRVRVEACGVCGSDHFLQEGGFGAKVPWPIVPGHEAAGRVDALGDGVTGRAPGDQVALYYISTPPGDRWAAAGRPNISPHVTRMGVDVDGAFAEYVLRPEVGDPLQAVERGRDRVREDGEDLRRDGRGRPDERSDRAEDVLRERAVHVHPHPGDVRADVRAAGGGPPVAGRRGDVVE
ncbi:MAG: alcohol dehydrogenase catalytic domain-containing protein, partial [Chloroflexota bacterium]